MKILIIIIVILVFLFLMRKNKNEKMINIDRIQSTYPDFYLINDYKYNDPIFLSNQIYEPRYSYYDNLYGIMNNNINHYSYYPYYTYYPYLWNINY